MNADIRALRAVAELHHAYLTGLLVALLVRRDEREVEELVFRLFRTKHLEQFLPGLEKLGLRGPDGARLPDAVVCAQYHYLSNFLGGVRVEYVPESERKAWVRYPPPRWIWQGVAIAAVPSAVSAAMLRGWHAHNGVTLGNPRLGFVCTKQTVDGQPGLEGYYYEYDHELEEAERLRFAPDEEAPPFDPALAPVVPAESWPEERLARAERNYAVDYVATLLPLLFEIVGESAARPIARHCARVIGLQYHERVCELLDVQPVAFFPELLRRLIEAMGDRVSVIDALPEDEPVGRHRERASELRQDGWRLERAVRSHPEALAEACFDSWSELFVGLALAHDRCSRLSASTVPSEDGRTIVWRFHRG